MKAVIHTQYGSPHVLQIAKVRKPHPKDNEVLIKICTTTVNRTDCGFRSAEYFISRLFSGLFRPKNQILGNEFAGIIEEIGTQVRSFKVGDKVFGYNDKTFGANAEYMAIDENSTLATLPINFSFEEAAPICEGGHYALVDIRAAKVKSGQNVLINGATGAIGSAAVQLVKHFGANVTAVCATESMELVKNLGADFVIDYTKEDFTKTGQTYDFIFDAVGKSSFAKCKKILKPKGIYISTELGKRGANVFLALFTPFFSQKKVLFPIPTISKEDVLFLKELVEKGEFKPVIDPKKYTLDQLIEATTYVESGQKIGNVIILVSEG